MDEADHAQEREAAYLADRLRAQARAAALGEPGSGICADCGEEIPAARRRALPSATRCVECQAEAERVNDKR
jgi:phage/conjugal plasmid C-4 type zinc finger TraR family protein